MKPYTQDEANGFVVNNLSGPTNVGVDVDEKLEDGQERRPCFALLFARARLGRDPSGSCFRRGRSAV